MRLLVNGVAETLDDGTTVGELVHSLVGSERGVAVAVDREVIPRGQWPTTNLMDGATVEVLAAAAGG